MITKLNVTTVPRDSDMWRPNSHCMGCTCDRKQVQQHFAFELWKQWELLARIEASDDAK